MTHLKRTQVSRRLPIPRKGTKYVARAANNVSEGVPVVVAIRDMLNLAKTSKEVKFMVNNKLVKVNGKDVIDIKESVRLFNVLHADKSYKMIVLPTGRFGFEESKGDSRTCKVIGKKVLKGNKVQVNLHDGTNLIVGKEKINVGDSLELDFTGKLKKTISFDKGKNAFVTSGRSIGKVGKILSVDGENAKIKFEDKEVELEKSHIIVQ